MTQAPGLGVLAKATPGVRPCPIAASLAVVGERWSLLAVREIGYGVRRFDQIVSFTGASRDILTDRLRTLTEAGVIERRQYCERPPRFEYHLTRAGEELFPVLQALARWGDRWALERPVVGYRHDCGHDLDAVQICVHCREEVTRQGVIPYLLRS